MDKDICVSKYYYNMKYMRWGSGVNVLLWISEGMMRRLITYTVKLDGAESSPPHS